LHAWTHFHPVLAILLLLPALLLFAHPSHLLFFGLLNLVGEHQVLLLTMRNSSLLRLPSEPLVFEAAQGEIPILSEYAAHQYGIKHFSPLMLLFCR
jgi:hypothetical protein